MANSYVLLKVLSANALFGSCPGTFVPRTFQIARLISIQAYGDLLYLLRSVVRSVTAVAVPLLISGCTGVGLSASEKARGEAGWDGASPQIYWSMLDAIEQSLSLEANHEDLHSYQIRMRKERGQSFDQQVNLITLPTYKLCNGEQGTRDWAALKCKAFTTQILANEVSEQCKGNRCIKIRLAPFVLNDEKLLNAVRLAANDPCQVIPSFQKNTELHGGQWPRGGGTVHRADVSIFWLFCKTKSPIRGNLASTETNDLFIVRWGR